MLHIQCFLAQFYKDKNRDKAKNIMCMHHWMKTKWYKRKLTFNQKRDP